MLLRLPSILALAIPACAQTICPPTPTYSPCDITFDVPATAGADFDLHAEFRSPSADTALANAFHNEGARWTIRFTPTEPGKYTMKVTVTDMADKNKTTATMSRDFQVLPKKFGFVRVELTTVPVGPREQTLPAAPLAVPGQTLLVNFALAGFDIDSKTMQPDLAVEMTVRDEAGKATTSAPRPDPEQIEGEGRV